jgi:F-type H+-transporting ATPase subunit delta
MGNYRVAHRYGTALLQSAEEEHLLEQTALDAEMIAETVRASRELRLALASPVVEKGKKKRILDELFGKRLTPVTARFLDLLTEKDREGQLLDILDEFLHLLDERRGVLRVEVTSAVDLTEAEKAQLSKDLETRTGKSIVPTFRRDPTIIGGFIVRLDDSVIDASLTHQLTLLRERFLASTGARAEP